MTGKPRTTFAKLQRERARQAKQAAKRARRQGTIDELGPLTGETGNRDAPDEAQSSLDAPRPETATNDPKADISE